MTTYVVPTYVRDNQNNITYLPGHVNYVADGNGRYPDVTDALMYWLTRLEDGNGDLTIKVQTDPAQPNWALAPRCIGATEESPVTIQFRRFMADGVTPAVYCVEYGLYLGMRIDEPLGTATDWQSLWTKWGMSTYDNTSTLNNIWMPAHYWKNAIFDLNGATLIQYDTTVSAPNYIEFYGDFVAGSQFITNMTFYDPTGALSPRDSEPSDLIAYDLATVSCQIPGATIKATWSTSTNWVTYPKKNTTAAPSITVSPDWVQLPVNATVDPITKAKAYPSNTYITEVDVANNRFRTSALPLYSGTDSVYVISTGDVVAGGKKIAVGGLTIADYNDPPDPNVYQIDLYGTQVVSPSYTRLGYKGKIRAGTIAARKQDGMSMLTINSPFAKPKRFPATWTAGVAVINSTTPVFDANDVGSLVSDSISAWPKGTVVTGIASSTQLITSAAPTASRGTARTYTIAAVDRQALAENITILGTSNPASGRGVVHMSNKYIDASGAARAADAVENAIYPGWRENWMGVTIRAVRNLTIQDVDFLHIWSDVFNFGTLDAPEVGWSIFPEEVTIENCRANHVGRHFFTIHGGVDILVDGGSYNDTLHWYIDCESFNGARLLYHTFRNVEWGDRDLGTVQFKPGPQTIMPPAEWTATGTAGSNTLTLTSPIFSTMVSAKVMHNDIPEWTIIKRVLSPYEIELNNNLTANITNESVVIYDPCSISFFEFDGNKHWSAGGFGVVSPGSLFPTGNTGGRQQVWNWSRQYFLADCVAGDNKLTNVRLCDPDGVVRRSGVRLDGRVFPLSNTALWVRSPSGAIWENVKIPINPTDSRTRTVLSAASRPTIASTVGDGISAGTNEIYLGPNTPTSPAQIVLQTASNVLFYADIAPVWWWGFVYKNQRNYGNGEFDGGHSGYGDDMPLLSLNPRWDYVTIIDNVMPAQLRQSDGAPTEDMVGWYRGNLYRTQGPPTSGATREIAATSWAVSGNYWPNALDNQYTPAKTVTPVVVTTFNHPAATGTRGSYRVQLNPSDSASLDDEPVSVRISNKPYASGGSGDLFPAGQNYYSADLFPHGPILTTANDTGIFTSAKLNTVGTYYLTAKYPGSLDYQYAVSSSVVQSVGAGTSTTTTVTSSPSSGITTSTSVTITATVSPSGATGTVSLYSVKSGVVTNYASQSVAGGVASFSVGTLAAGNHLFVATFNPSGGGAYFGSSGSLDVPVDSSALTPTVTSISAPVESSLSTAQSVTVSASVSPSVSGTFTLSDLYEDATTTIGTSTANGSTSFAGLTFSAGVHALAVQFIPESASYSGSVDSKVLTMIDPEPVILTASANPAFANGIYDGETLDISVESSPAVSGLYTLTDTHDEATVTVASELASGGVILFSSVALSGAGAHLLSIDFTPASNFYTSASLDNEIMVYDLLSSRGWSAGALDS